MGMVKKTPIDPAADTSPASSSSSGWVDLDGYQRSVFCTYMPEGADFTPGQTVMLAITAAGVTRPAMLICESFDRDTRWATFAASPESLAVLMGLFMPYRDPAA